MSLKRVVRWASVKMDRGNAYCYMRPATASQRVATWRASAAARTNKWADTPTGQRTRKVQDARARRTTIKPRTAATCFDGACAGRLRLRTTSPAHSSTIARGQCRGSWQRHTHLAGGPSACAPAGESAGSPPPQQDAATWARSEVGAAGQTCQGSRRRPGQAAAAASACQRRHCRRRAT